MPKVIIHFQLGVVNSSLSNIDKKLIFH